jgi:mannitol/fructose-specific phosphotransferase system IIA component (Ntr-type)
MKFSDFIVPQAIRPSLLSDEKEAVIREMVQALVDAGQIDCDVMDSVVASILRREELGSTGIGRGVAVPHAKHASLSKLVGLVAVSPDGVDFRSLDGEKVHIFFFLVSPSDLPSEHLKALEYISRQVRNETFCRFLQHATTAAEIQQILTDADNTPL